MEIPVHVAIILDGNGRWAKAKGLPRNAGHAQGAKNVENICRVAKNAGIKYLTLYAFSTENWKRPSWEVSALMKLFQSYIKTCMKSSAENNMRVRFIGDKTGLSKSLQKSMIQLEEFSSQFDGFFLQIAVNYGSRDEILRSMRKIAEDVKNGVKQPEEISEEDVERYLDTMDIPDPDLMIRTSGEQRISNFLLWQMAYSELYFTKVNWPDFDEKELQKAIEEYQNRNRRYGKIEESEDV